MSKPQTQRPKPPPSGRTNLASCIVATIFLIFIVIVSLIVYFTVFKPKDVKISVSSVQLPSFSILNSTVNFTFSQYVAVRNPNRAAFRHYDSTLQLLYSGNQVGFMFIPAGVIQPGQTQFMAATFAVNSFPVSDPNLSGAVQGPIGSPVFGDGLSGFRGGGVGGGGGPTLEIESRLQMAGRVRVMHFFTHHAEANSGCRVDIAVSDGSVLGFHC
ncbi:PREDICTED: uncharacterized protein LOC101292795 [Fragaria vesca subsp. vesca]|uniref:uncharacterized protein LOC101292795 n=1 Tax=Fragaria vesca subsp. vesca TaxID=101020 RepID=UPI0002C35579|nr:PREDICTED: uncharacterized protein LOC101292795 [Fragaria vesca subsp. vesca]